MIKSFPEYGIKNPEHRIKANHLAKKGFTLLETLIVVGAMAVIAAAGLTLNSGLWRKNALDTTNQEIISLLNLARQKSIAQEGGYQWGVHFENPANDRGFYALYYNSYSSSTQSEIRYLSDPVIFITPTTSTSLDILFNKLIGNISTSTQQIVIGLQDTTQQKTINICPQGTVVEDYNSCFTGITDTTPPTIGAISVSPSNGTYTAASFSLSASVTDNESSVTNCEYTINGVSWQAASLSGSSSNYVCSKDNITADDGTNMILNIRATSSGGTGTGTSLNRTMDAVGPTCSDNWTDNWTNTSPVSVTISCSDTRSGVATTKYCVDSANTCDPSTGTAGTSASVSCSAGQCCTQYVRYAAWDNVGNASSVYSKRVRQDLQAPTDGTLTATAGDSQVSLSWSGFSDSGSGLAASNTYKLVYATGSAPSSCSAGTQIYLGTATSYNHTGLTNGTTYYYRVCAYDNVGNVSSGATASATTVACCTCGSWSSWSNVGCGVSPCSSGYMKQQQTRTCTPSGCNVETQYQCVADTCGSWGTCTASSGWTNAGCGAGGCSSSQMYQTSSSGTQTRTCTYGCLPTSQSCTASQCVNDTCTSWSACGGCTPATGSCTCTGTQTCTASTYGCLVNTTRSCTYTSPNGTVCRPAANECDVAETCSNGTCPANSYAAAGTQCTDTNTSDCYDAQCDGSGNCSQTRGYEASSYICRPAVGPCDIAEYCTGSSGTCPTDTYRSSGDWSTCTATCKACNGTKTDTCTLSLTANNGPNCTDACNYCSSGSCVLRSSGDRTECATCYKCDGTHTYCIDTGCTTGCYGETYYICNAVNACSARTCTSDCCADDPGCDYNCTDSTCLLANTKISMADGSYKNVEDIEVGDLVKAPDYQHQQTKNTKVIKVKHHLPEEMVTDNYLVVNNLLRLTPNHKLDLPDGGHIFAGELKVGDVVWGEYGPITIKSIEKVYQRVPTYDLVTESGHYFADGFADLIK